MTNLEDIIRQHISLPRRAKSNGWFSVLCKVCNDHGRKGPRAGFNFDGPKVGYNCFNCGHAAVYDQSTSGLMSKDMKIVLDAFGVPKDEWQRIVFHALANQDITFTPSERNRDIEPSVLQLPNSFYPLTEDSSDEWAVAANDHLMEKRRMTCEDYPFYLSRKTDNLDEKKWFGRLIIPVFKGKNIIFWQGRDLSDTRTRKYLSPDVPRENVLHGYDLIQEETNTPLYVVEGFFDAFALKGVAVFGSKMNPNQLRWLKDTKRPKVVVPDRTGNGISLAEQALELGWSISTPDIGSCKDVSDAVVRYGLLYTLRTIKDSTSSGYEGAVRAKLYCDA